MSVEQLSTPPDAEETAFLQRELKKLNIRIPTLRAIEILSGGSLYIMFSDALPNFDPVPQQVLALPYYTRTQLFYGAITISAASVSLALRAISERKWIQKRLIPPSQQPET